MSSIFLDTPRLDRAPFIGTKPKPESKRSKEEDNKLTPRNVDQIFQSYMEQAKQTIQFFPPDSQERLEMAFPSEDKLNQTLDQYRVELGLFEDYNSCDKKFIKKFRSLLIKLEAFKRQAKNFPDYFQNKKEDVDKMVQQAIEHAHNALIKLLGHNQFKLAQRLIDCIGTNIVDVIGRSTLDTVEAVVFRFPNREQLWSIRDAMKEKGFKRKSDLNVSAKVNFRILKHKIFLYLTISEELSGKFGPITASHLCNHVFKEYGVCFPIDLTEIILKKKG